MSLRCSCGCGEFLPDNESRVNEFGKLETMREDCIRIGRGEALSMDEMLNLAWDDWLATLSEEDREELSSGGRRKSDGGSVEGI